MAIFDIDPEQTMNSVISALEEAGVSMSQEKFNQIANAIETAMPGVIQVLAQGVSEYWRDEADSAGGWGPIYAAAIKYKAEGTKAEVYIDETTSFSDRGKRKFNIMFAMMMEQGVKSWSIKDALLKSDKAKIGKDGIKYIIIPFPVATPRKGSSGKMKSQFGGRVMTSAMYKIVKDGGRLGAGTIMVGNKEVNVSGLSKFNTRQLHGQYGIFRCVSEKSKGWIYPDIPAEPIYANVLKKINTQIQEAIAEFCKAIVEEFSK